MKLFTLTGPDEASALTAGYRPCSHCLPGRATALVSGAAEPIQS